MAEGRHDEYRGKQETPDWHQVFHGVPPCEWHFTARATAKPRIRSRSAADCRLTDSALSALRTCSSAALVSRHGGSGHGRVEQAPDVVHHAIAPAQKAGLHAEPVPLDELDDRG